MQWYYAVGDQRNGPVSQQEFDQLVRNGTIQSDTLVWKQGMANWQPWASVQGPTAEPPVMAGTDEPTEVCVVSGKRYPRREMLQFEGQWIAAEHRDTYFQRLREGVNQPGTFTYGGFLIRFVAKLIDGICMYALQIPLNMALAFMFYGTPNFVTNNAGTVGVQKALVYTAVSTPLGILLGVAFSWFFISRFDATPGKMAFGLKVVRSNGAKLSTGRIVGRHFAEWISAMILCIGYIIAAFDDEKQTLHDRICDTRVIKAR